MPTSNSTCPLGSSRRRRVMIAHRPRLARNDWTGRPGIRLVVDRKGPCCCAAQLKDLTIGQEHRPAQSKAAYRLQRTAGAASIHPGHRRCVHSLGLRGVGTETVHSRTTLYCRLAAWSTFHRCSIAVQFRRAGRTTYWWRDCKCMCSVRSRTDQNIAVGQQHARATERAFGKRGTSATCWSADCRFRQCCSWSPIRTGDFTA